MFHTASIVISLAALLHWLNTKYLKLPTTLGVMLISLFASLILVLFTEAEAGLRGQFEHVLLQIDFHALVFHSMLPFLLFAGALHINFQDLKREWRTVTLHACAPIAVVVAGLCIGNQGRAFSMSPRTAKRLDEFWELIDDFLNVYLFMLMGIAVIILPFHHASLVEGAAAIARLIALAVADRRLHRSHPHPLETPAPRRQCPHSHLGRSSRRCLSRPGAFAPDRRTSRQAPDRSLHRGDFFRPRARPDHRPAHSIVLAARKPISQFVAIGLQRE